MKKILFGLITSIVISIQILSGMIVFAQNTTELEIVPKVSQDKLGTINNAIQNGTGHVWDNYDKQLSGLSVSEKIASGVMDRNTILDYGVYMLRFLSQAGLLVGALMCIYTGYTYILNTINGYSIDEKLLPRAITGILVIIFSYAIMRILTRAFLT